MRMQQTTTRPAEQSPARDEAQIDLVERTTNRELQCGAHITHRLQEPE